jgi:hypothetical protein
MTGRFYASHRRAWTPRFWPLALAAVAVIVPVDLLLLAHGPLGSLEAAATGVIVALAVGIGRWEIWKHRHPVITADEYLDDLRAKAHLN